MKFILYIKCGKHGFSSFRHKAGIIELQKFAILSDMLSNLRKFLQIHMAKRKSTILIKESILKSFK